MRCSTVPYQTLGWHFDDNRPKISLLLLPQLLLDLIGTIVRKTMVTKNDAHPITEPRN